MTELVDITAFGDTEPRYLTAGWSDRDVAIAKAKALYVAGEIDVDELERRVGEAVAPQPERRHT
jgi:hypothetical protein